MPQSSPNKARVCLRGFCDSPAGDSQLSVEASIGDRKGRATITLKRGQARMLLEGDGGRGLIHRFNEVDVQTEGGLKFHLAGRKPVEAQISPVNPDKAKPLMFANLDPDKKGVRLVPCATANVSDKGTAVYVGFSFENIVENVGEAFRTLVEPAFGWGRPK